MSNLEALSEFRIALCGDLLVAPDLGEFGGECHMETETGRRTHS